MRGSKTIRRRIPNTHYFSTFSGRGRGRGSPFGFTPNQPDDSKPDPPPQPDQPAPGRGRGRGFVVSNPTLPSFSSFVSSVQNNPNPIGRPPPATNPTAPPQPKLPENIYSDPNPIGRPASATNFTAPPHPNLPENIYSGAGRGKPVEAVKAEVENRHLRAKPRGVAGGERKTDVSEKKEGGPKLSREEALAKAMQVLRSRAELGEGGGGGGGRGRGRGIWRGRGRGRGRGRRGRDDAAEKEDYGGLYLGDNADGEKFAQRIGVENMNKLVDGFEEMSDRLLPSPVQDALLEAWDTNFKFEFEEEYLMGEFDKNPELEEKEAMDIRDVLEKLKPFLMAYEGLRSQQEWEEAVEATMKNVPLFHQIVEYYSGPERITAKTQQEMLENVAKTVPPSVPASVKQFTNRAMLSLQSNPGWGLDKKYQFMDKLVSQVSQHYK